MLEEHPERFLQPNPNSVKDPREVKGTQIEPEKWPTYSQIVSAIRDLAASREELESIYEVLSEDLQKMLRAPEEFD